MAEILRSEVVRNKPVVKLSNKVEFDEVYVIAGHKGKSNAIKGRKPRRNRLKGGSGTLAKEKPSIFEMIQRNGNVYIEMLPNVKQKAIQPIIEAVVEKETLIYPDEYARDEDDDGFHEVHVNTMEGFGPLLRSWLRPHRGISQEKLPLYLRFFEFTHNAKKRGRALLGSLLRIFYNEVKQPPAKAGGLNNHCKWYLG